MQKRVAIIGTGIAGMSCGYRLKDTCDVTFFEKDSRPGGHTNTVMVDEDGQSIPIDTGFIVYNEVTYPNLVKFFNELEIPTKETSMSFSFQHLPTALEYCGTGLNGLFAQRRNIFNPRFIRMLQDVNRFNRECVEILDDPKYSTMTLRQYALEKGFGYDFLAKYIVPMSSAIWSTDAAKMLDFPAVTLVIFFKNHGLLGLTTHYPWRTVCGGSRVYRDKVLNFFNGKVHLDADIRAVTRDGKKGVIIDSNSQMQVFDAVVLACHADQALALLSDPSENEKNILGVFRYQKNHAMLHTDDSLMPKKRIAWSSWNYRVGPKKDGVEATSCIYWMNGLQGVSENKNYFVSINDPGWVNPKKKIWETFYEHPIYNLETIRAQESLPSLNGQGAIFFCGSYFKYGFHEDAFNAGREAADAILSL